MVLGYRLPVVLLLLSAASLVFGDDAAAFHRVSWTPQQLQSGSVCLFTVTVSSSASALNGTWMGHELFFARGREPGTWFAVAGIDVEEKPGTYPLKLQATMAGGQPTSILRTVQVLSARYKTVKLRVAERYVAPDAATLQLIEADKLLKSQAFAHEAPAPEWSGDFEAPVTSTVAEPFGTRRTFNGKLASVHRGVDYHAKPGTAVLASNSGEVVLARPLFYEGNCVMIDHGQGFMTIYMHLSKLLVAPGDKVTKGEEIGLSGATGRVTGPHLHMAARWEGAYVDPLKLLKLRLPVLQ